MWIRDDSPNQLFGRPTLLAIVSRVDIHQTPEKPAWILLGMITCPLKGAKIIDEAWYSEIGGVQSQLRNLHITGTGLKWDYADVFQ
jgi:hypothetical protein